MSEQQRMKRKLLEAFDDNDVIVEENFAIFHGGGMGVDYVDVDTILSDYGDRAQLVDDLVAEVHDEDAVDVDEYDAVAFLDKDYGPVGLLPYASEISNRLQLPAVTIRLSDRIRLDAMKVKGVNVLKGDGVNGDKVLIFDDVVTSGSTQREAIDIVENWGADVEGLVSVYARKPEVLDDLKEEKGLRYATTMLSYMDCLDYGLVLSDDPDDYRVDIVDRLQELYDLSDEEATELEENLDTEVETVLRDAVESLIDERDLADDSEEKEQLLNAAYSAFDDDVKQTLKSYLPRGTAYTENSRGQADD